MVGSRGVVMYHVIICEDHYDFREKIKEITDRVMFDTNLEYHKHVFDGYNDELADLINQNLMNKIYILDMQMSPVRGIDIAREIRRQDSESIIIFVTAYKKTFRDEVLNSVLMYFAFIQKNEEFGTILYDRLTQAVKMSSKNPPITFNDQNRLYKIPFQKVLFVTMSKYGRKSTIYTDVETFNLSKTLKETVKLFKNQLVQAHRSYFVNPNRVLYVDKNQKTVTFDNGETYPCLSNKYRDCLDDVLLSKVHETIPNDSKRHNHS